MHRRRLSCPSRLPGSTKIFAAIASACFAPAAGAGVIFNYSPANTIGGGSRWDAAPRNITLGGVPTERSLDGGLRFSLQGGSYQAFRDLFTWTSTPSVADFTSALNQAFGAWTIVDPATNYGTAVSFVPDLDTPVVGSNTGAGGLSTRGAEIDLFGSTDAGFWNVGNGGTQGETRFGAVSGTVKLTSGTTNYAGSTAISGADIIMNSNSAAVYSLDVFRRILTHEIGHSIGLGDVEGSIQPGNFIDDNYNGATNSTALATLTNSWAALVNPVNPAASPLSRFTPGTTPGTSTTGVDILMESNGVGIGPTNPVTNLTPLTNDDFGTRQFLYPYVPEPASAVIGLIGITALTVGRCRRPAKAT